MQHRVMIQCAVQGAVEAGGGAGLLQVDVLRRARDLHELFVVRLERFAERQTRAAQDNSP